MSLLAFWRHPVPGFLPFGLPLCPFCHCFDFQPLKPLKVRVPYSRGLPFKLPGLSGFPACSKADRVPGEKQSPAVPLKA